MRLRLIGDPSNLYSGTSFSKCSRDRDALLGINKDNIEFPVDNPAHGCGDNDEGINQHIEISIPGAVVTDLSKDKANTERNKGINSRAPTCHEEIIDEEETTSDVNIEEPHTEEMSSKKRASCEVDCTTEFVTKRKQKTKNKRLKVRKQSSVVVESSTNSSRKLLSSPVPKKQKTSQSSTPGVLPFLPKSSSQTPVFIRRNRVKRKLVVVSSTNSSRKQLSSPVPKKQKTSQSSTPGVLPFLPKSSSQTPASIRRNRVKRKLFNISDFYDSQVSADGESDNSLDNYLESHDAEQNSFIDDSTNFSKDFIVDPGNSPNVRVGNLDLNQLAKKYIPSSASSSNHPRKRLYISSSSDSD